MCVFVCAHKALHPLYIYFYIALCLGYITSPAISTLGGTLSEPFDDGARDELEIISPTIFFTHINIRIYIYINY